MTKELADINCQRIPLWISEYHRWANHAEGRAVEYAERGDKKAAMTARMDAAAHRMNAEYALSNLIGFASI